MIVESSIFTAIENETIIFDVVDVYPNPSQESLFILNKESEWSVYTLKGELVTAGNGREINLKNQPSGVYLFKALNQNVRIVIP